MFGTLERLKDCDRQIDLRRDAGLDRLSRQELAVLQEMALGASNAEIAQRLHLREQMVAGCVAHIVEKLDLPVRLAAIRLARENGLRPR